MDPLDRAFIIRGDCKGWKEENVIMEMQQYGIVKDVRSIIVNIEKEKINS